MKGNIMLNYYSANRGINCYFRKHTTNFLYSKSKVTVCWFYYV